MDEQSLVVRQGGHTTNRILQQMNSNRSSNQSQGKANGKNRPRKQKAQKPEKPRRRVPRERPDRVDRTQIGAVIRTNLVRPGMSDIKSHRFTYLMGTTYVGNGVAGNANGVYFQTADNLSLCSANSATSSGQLPVAPGDSKIGQTYVGDILKHYTRVVIKRAWIHCVSLQPSTANNMMAVIGCSRGGSATEAATVETKAAAAGAPNTVAAVSSMRGAVPVDSFETKSWEVSDMIAGGSGARQNEFQIGNQVAGTTVLGASTVPSGVDGNGLIPFCIAVGGNCTTAALQATAVHEILVELEVDLIDYIGGMPIPNAVL